MKRAKPHYTEQEIDEMVVREADDASRWRKLIRVQPSTAVAIHLTPTLIEKAKAIARRKKMRRYETWLLKVIKERIESEKIS